MEEDYEYYLESELKKNPVFGDFDKYDTYSIHYDIKDTFDIIKRTKKGKCGEIFIEENDLFSFLCTLCEAPFSQIEQFYLHVKSKHNSLKHNDNTCTRTKSDNGEKPDKRNQQTDELKNFVDVVQNFKKEEIRIENKQNTYMAKINEDKGCDDNIDNKFDKDSLINCNEKEKYSCNVCQKEYPFKSSIQRHIFMKHTPFSDIPDKFKCNICHKHFENKQRKEKHDRTHTSEKSFQCQFCKECFQTKQSCTSHEKSHTSHFDKCNEDTSSTEASIEHTNSLHEPIENLNQQTLELENFVDHIQNVEEKEIKIEVHENPNEDDEYYDFQVQNVEEKENKIEINGNFYRYDGSHDNESKFSCSIHERNHCTTTFYDRCNKEYFSKKKLVNHNNLEHKPYENLAKIKAFQCSYCGKSSKSKKIIINHELIHTGEKLFPCETCGKSFRTKSILELHKEVHNSERQYKCQQCDKRFKSKNVLYSHLHGHKYNKRYKCSICKKSFSRRFSVLRHEKNIHHHEGI